MPDQADNLRQLVDTAPPLARAAVTGPPLVVVTGGKGGAGTTTVSVNLAAALADAGLRVVLVDAARQNADIARAAGIDLAETKPHPDRIVDNKRRSAVTLQPGPAGALLLASGTPDSDQPMHPRRAQHRLLAELRLLPADTDLVLLDAGCGVTPSTRRLWRQARLVLVVTTTDDAAVMDSYATIKLAAADELDAELRILVNQCDTPPRADEVHHRLSAACQRFLGRDVPAVPHLPRCAAEEQAARGMPPRVWESPDSPFGHAALWLGRAVVDVLATAARQPPAAAEHRFAA